jgi:hypothetical protein
LKDKKIDLLLLKGHADHQGQLFGQYEFGATQLNQEADCMRQALSNDAQVVLLGCNTALKLNGEMSVAEKVSKLLPGTKVAGVAGYYNENLSHPSFEQGEFTFISYLPESLTGWIWPGSSSVTYYEKKII